MSHNPFGDADDAATNPFLDTFALQEPEEEGSEKERTEEEGEDYDDEESGESEYEEIEVEIEVEVTDDEEDEEDEEDGVEGDAPEVDASQYTFSDFSFKADASESVTEEPAQASSEPGESPKPKQNPASEEVPEASSESPTSKEKALVQRSFAAGGGSAAKKRWSKALILTDVTTIGTAPKLIQRDPSEFSYWHCRQCPDAKCAWGFESNVFEPMFCKHCGHKHQLKTEAEKAADVLPVDELRAKIAEMAMEIEQLKNKAAESDAFAKELLKARERIAELETEVEEMLQEELAREEAQLAAIKCLCCKSAFVDTEGELCSNCTTFTQRLKGESEGGMAALQAKLDEAIAKAAKAQKDADKKLEDTIAAHNQELAEHKAVFEKEEAEQELRYSELEDQVSELNQQLDGKSADNEDLLRQLEAQHELHNKELENVKTQLSAYSSSASDIENTLRSQLETLQKDLQVTADAAAEAKLAHNSEVGDLKLQLSQQTSALEKAKSEISKLQATVAQRDEEIAKLKQQIEELKAQHEAEMQEGADLSSAEHTKLLERIQGLETDQEDLLSELENAAQQLEEATTKPEPEVDDGPTEIREAIEDDVVDMELIDHLKSMGFPPNFRCDRVSAGKYRLGNARKVVNIREVGTMVMVRVGGGWQELKEYLDSVYASAFNRTSQDRKVKWSMQDREKKTGKNLKAAAKQITAAHKAVKSSKSGFPRSTSGGRVPASGRAPSSAKSTSKAKPSKPKTKTTTVKKTVKVKKKKKSSASLSNA